MSQIPPKVTDVGWGRKFYGGRSPIIHIRTYFLDHARPSPHTLTHRIDILNSALQIVISN